MSRFAFNPRTKPGYVYAPNFVELFEALGNLVNIMGGIEGMIEEAQAADALGLEDDEYQLPDKQLLDEMYIGALEDAYQVMSKVDNGFELAIQALWEMYGGALAESIRENEPIITLLLTSRIILNVIGNLTQKYSEEHGITPVIWKDDDGQAAQGN
jgi:hypothetical protein